jgi:putative ABC transport system permease protein
MTAIYRLALYLLPAHVRRWHGEQMATVFADLLREARRRRGWRGACRVAARELIALVRFGWYERGATLPPPRIDEHRLSWTLEPQRRLPMLASLTQDLRYGARMLWHAPAFTLVCVVTMALAIGANTAIFSVVNGVLLKALPFADPERVVVIGHRSADGGDGDGLGSTTPGNFYDWQARADAFDAMAGFTYTDRVITLAGNAERARGGLSVSSIFDVLGRGAASGRTFTAREDAPGAPAVVVLSHTFARKWFGERSPIDASIGIGGVPHTVIGVMPPDFTFPDYDADYWIPARLDAAMRGNRDQYFLLAVARLKSGVSLDQAGAQINTVMDAIRRDYPQFTQNAIGAIVPAKDLMVSDVRTRLLTLMAAVVVILLIACANLGNLLLARAATRRREVAVRQALGARPRRLVQQLLTESVLLAAVGGAAGLVLGYVLLNGLVTLLTGTLPRVNEIGLDGRVMLFTAVASLAAGLVFGIIPALHVAAAAPMEAVREGTRGSARSARVRTTLVVTEVALAVILLAGAGLLVRSFAKLLEVNPGFTAEGMLTFRVGIPPDVYRQPARRVAFFDDALTRVRQLPGVRAAAISSYLPVTGYGTGAWLNRIDRPTPPDRTPTGVAYRVVSSNYFEVLGIPLRRGRLLTEGDRLDGVRAVVISEAAAKRFWPDEDPIGKRIYMGAPDNRLFPDAEVVGIVGDVTQLSLDNPRAEAVYFTHGLMPSWSTFSFAVRTTVEPASVTSAVREQLRQIDPAVPMFAIQSMDDVIALSRAPARLSMLLVGLFAVLALILAVIGVFGVSSYTVSQRATELGIRLALGANARALTLSVIGQGLLPVVGGLVLGSAGALALTRLMTTLLFGVTPTDPATYAAVAVLLMTVAAVAAYMPARRAANSDPVRVLREP